MAPHSHTSDQEARPLGAVTELALRSSLSPFHSLLGHKVRYPAVVVEAMAELYMEYNLAFGPLVAANREWGTDYQYAMFGPGNSPVNFGVQFDMLGLTQEFVDAAVAMTVTEVRELLRGMIFEIENSMAMYQFMERGGGSPFFADRYRAALAEMRERWGKPIALLAITQEKYEGMLASEFGKNPGETITDEEVQELSGFDRLFGPDEFREYIAGNGGECGYLLYVRSSDPQAKLKKPGVKVDHPLLGDPEMRRLIKANAVTFNVDDPEMAAATRINDTKGYMEPMGLAFEIGTEADLFSEEFTAFLARGKLYADFEGKRLSDRFIAFLKARGIDPDLVESGEVHLRAKPLKGAFGCYGHVTGPLPAGKKFRSELRRNLRTRGRYVVQPELVTPCIIDTDTAATYTYIDRVMMGIVDGKPVLMGGFRMMLPVDSHEARSKRIHGNGSTLWAEITS